MLGLNPVHWYIIGILVTSTTIGGIVLVEPPLLKIPGSSPALDLSLRRLLSAFRLLALSEGYLWPAPM